MGTRTFRLPILLAAVLGTGAMSCEVDIPVQEFRDLAPMGVIQGQVLYDGPPPCTENGHIVGAAVFYLFPTNALPPPDGLSGSVANIGAVGGDVLFNDLFPLLKFNADGSRACPEPGTAPVSASADFVISPVGAGEYQIRAFFDLDGGFDPAFSYSNLPTKGDVAGGALQNAGAFLAGESPEYAVIQVGTPDANGALAIPPNGVRLDNVGVVLARPNPLQLPYFYYAAVTDEQYGNTDPNHVVMPTDYWAKDFSLAGVEESLLRVQLASGVPESEKSDATSAPFSFRIDDPGKLMLYRYDSNGDGKIAAGDNIPESTLVPWLQPWVIWSKVADPAGMSYQKSPSPTVIILGITFANDSLLASAGFTSIDPVPFDHLTIAVRPAAICIDASKSPAEVALVSPKEKDQKGGYILGEDTSSFKAPLAALMGTSPDNVAVMYACMPKGKYGAAVIYNSGQVWFVPNEAGVCLAREEPGNFDASGSAMSCGTRARLPSQASMIEIGAAQHGAEECYNIPADQVERYKSNCLSAEERVAFDNRTLY